MNCGSKVVALALFIEDGTDGWLAGSECPAEEEESKNECYEWSKTTYLIFNGAGAGASKPYFLNNINN